MNRIHSYTDQHFAAFEIVEGSRFGRPVAVVRVGASRMPIVFTSHGGYSVPGGQKAAFVKGSVYFRYGAKSEPGTTEDLRLALERELEVVKEFWLQGRQSDGRAGRLDGAGRSARRDAKRHTCQNDGSPLTQQIVQNRMLLAARRANGA